MQIGNTFRIYPDKNQAKVLLNWIGCQRFIYNSKVAEDKYFKSFNKKFLVDSSIGRGFDQSYSHFKDKELTPWLFDVPSVILRNGAVLWKQAYSRFYKKLAGRPTFKTKHGKRSVWLTSELFEFIEIKDEVRNTINRELTIGNKKYPIGKIKINTHKKFDLPKTIHISVIAGKWFVSFNYDDKTIEPSDKDNRKNQSRFICLSCGYQDNADSNANKILKKRGIELVLSKEYQGKKESTKVGSLSKKIGQDLSESVIKSSKLVEIVLDTNDSKNQKVQLSKKQETPTRNSQEV